MNPVRNLCGNSWPAHAAEFEALVLHQHAVKEVVHADAATATTPVPDALAYLQKTEAWTLPVLKDGRLVAMCTLRDLLRVPDADRPNRTVADVLAPGLITVTPNTDLFQVLTLLLEHDLNGLPVVADGDGGQLLGLVTRRDISAVVQAARKRRPLSVLNGLAKVKTSQR